MLQMSRKLRLKIMLPKLLTTNLKQQTTTTTKQNQPRAKILNKAKQRSKQKKNI